MHHIAGLGGGGYDVFDLFVSQSVISATLTAAENFVKLYR